VSGTPLDLVQGTVDILILRAIAWGPMHGYAISQWIRQRTDGALEIESAAMYPALHRLERRQWVSAAVGLRDPPRRAKYYQLTPLGRQQLQTECDTWRAYVAAVARVLDPA
jgi:PadR family transcriptional regulator, regulatory protein PadR